MKRSLLYLLVPLLALALMPGKTFSQQIFDKQADEASRQKAYRLLESLAEEIGTLQSGENRARMGSNIAQSLWPHNEAKAREMFATVTKEIKAGLEDNSNDQERYLARPNFVKLREDTALRIGVFDPEWALQFLEETKPIHDYIKDEDKNDLNLRLAIVSVEKDPELALRLGRESLKHGVSARHLWLIYTLTKRSRTHASALLGEIVKVAPSQNIRTVMNNEQFYLMLARWVEPDLGSDPAFRDLMNYFTEVALEAGCGKKKVKDNDGFCYRIGLVVPLIEKVDARRAAPLKHIARKSAYPYEWSPELSDYADVYQNGSVDDLLAMLPKYPEFRSAGQMFVIRKVLESGDIQRARKLSNEFAWQEPSSKQSVVKALDDAQRIVDEDTAEEILGDAKAFSDTGGEFSYLFWKATEIGSRNRQTTVKVLDRANELLDRVPPEKWQMQYRIGIAAKYCQVKSDRCFTMMEQIVGRMNELVSAAAKLNGFDNRYLRNGEWNMTAEGGVGSLLTGMAQNAVYFALADFDRALALSSQFERREIRMMAQLKLAQGLLEGPPKKPLFPDPEH